MVGWALPRGLSTLVLSECGWCMTCVRVVEMHSGLTESAEGAPLRLAGRRAREDGTGKETVPGSKEESGLWDDGPIQATNRPGTTRNLSSL